MSWFAAHLIMTVKLKGKRQRRFPVWENIVLIEADSKEQAFRKAEHRGRLDEGDDDGSFTWGGQPATWVFAGVRKLTQCEDFEARPSDGTEVTYLEFELDSQEAVNKLVEGRQVSLRSNERFPEEPIPEEPTGKTLVVNNSRRRKPA
jgi:uncharacterized protein DUF4288